MLERIEQEEEYNKEQLKRQIEAEEDRKMMMELVKINEIKRKNQDKITKGYKSVHNDTTVWLKSLDEIEKEESIEKEKKEQGEAIGQQWIKTEFGWTRGYDPEFTYKTGATNDYLPTWLFKELNLIFGLRRTNSPDFRTSCIILKYLIKQYYESTKSLQKKIMYLLSFIDKQIKRNNSIELSG
jgi:hypothetical protein